MKALIIKQAEQVTLVAYNSPGASGLQDLAFLRGGSDEGPGTVSLMNGMSAALNNRVMTSAYVVGSVIN